MTTNTFLSDNAHPEGKFLSTDTIGLSQQQVERAIAASCQGQTADTQWQIYLQALAWQGVQEWLQKRAPQLSAHVPELAETVSGWIQVGPFRVQLVVTDALENAEVSVPESAITDPNKQAHFYVLVEVLEDIEQVTVGGYLRYDHLLGQGQLPLSDGLCWLTVDWFEASGDRLLLELQALNPAALDLEPAPGNPQSTPTLPQRVINTGLWLRDQLDQAAQELAWVLLPPPAMSLAIAMRSATSPLTQFSDMVSNLAEQQVPIPPDARAAYKGLLGPNYELYLYVITWELAPDEWSLLAVLAAPSGTVLPPQSGLQILEGTEPLVIQRAAHATDGGYLFAQVAGTQEEEFAIQVELPGQGAIALPPFRFDKYGDN